MLLYFESAVDDAAVEDSLGLGLGFCVAGNFITVTNNGVLVWDFRFGFCCWCAKSACCCSFAIARTPLIRSEVFDWIFFGWNIGCCFGFGLAFGCGLGEGGCGVSGGGGGGGGGG